MKERIHRFCRAQTEIIRFGKFQMMTRSQHETGLILDLFKRNILLATHMDLNRSSRAINLLKSADGNNNKKVLCLTQCGADLFCYPNYLKGCAIDFEFFPNRIKGIEELMRN